jgi:hypothetical protein
MGKLVSQKKLEAAFFFLQKDEVLFYTVSF